MTDKANDRRRRIAAAFGRARGYDDAADVQRAVAEELAKCIAIGKELLPPDPYILELGCGTGFLTRALADHIGAARWLVSDIAPEMVKRARLSFDRDAEWRVIDGENVDPALGNFDLIVSNLAFQWFNDLAGAVARLLDRLTPGGTLAFSTMASGSFAEWTAALEAEGLRGGTPAYPTCDELAALAPTSFEKWVGIRAFSRPQPGARAFLQQLKAIGANIPAVGYRPLPPTALRRAMQRFDAGPRIVSYQIGVCLFRRVSGRQSH